MSYSLRLLGPPALLVAGEWQPIAAQKPTLLLLYLAARGVWLERTELCALFFGEGPLEAGRLSLRQLISRARRLEWAGALEVEGDRLRFMVPSDLAHFRTHLGNQRWEQALEGAQGELLEGMIGPTAFMRWLEAERLEVHDGWQQTCLNDARRLSDSGHFEAAVMRLETVLRSLSESGSESGSRSGSRSGSGPVRESILRLYLESAQRCGQQALALERFRTYCSRLLEDYGLLPGESVLNLAHALEQDWPVGRTLAYSSGAPACTTPLWGRDLELKFWQQAIESSHRLMWLWAEPGMGKTRLVLELCARVRSAGRAVYYLDASSAQASGVTLETLLADALHLTLEQRASGEAGLWQALNAGSILLVLDHIRASETLLTRLLEHCPALCILGVGRETHPQAPFVHQLPGLSGEGALELLEGVGRRVSPEKRAVNAALALEGHDYPTLVVVLCVLAGLELPSALEKPLERCFERVWDGLTESEQGALVVLSHFVEGCSARTAEALGVTPALQRRFERRGFLQGHEGWVWLHGSLSQWVLERETREAEGRTGPQARSKWQGEGHALERNHFFHSVRTLGEQDLRLGSSQTAEQLARLDADRVSLRRALRWGLLNAREREVEAAFESLVYGYGFYSALEGGPQTLGQTLPLLIEPYSLETGDLPFVPLVSPSLEAQQGLERMRLGLGLGLTSLGSLAIACKLTRFAAQRLLELGAKQGAALAWGLVALLELSEGRPAQGSKGSSDPWAALELASLLAGRPFPRLEGSPHQQALTLSGWLEALHPVSADPRHQNWTRYCVQMVLGHGARLEGAVSTGPRSAGIAAREAYGRALAGAQQLGHAGAMAWAQLHSGQAYLLEGNLNESLGCLNLALEAAKRMVAPFLMLESLGSLVELHTLRPLSAGPAGQVERDLERLRNWPHRSDAFHKRASGLLEHLKVGVG